MSILSALNMEARQTMPVVVDSLTHKPLANASVFDRNGRIAGMSDSRGVISYIPASDYPITIRYMGFHEKAIANAQVDTIFMRESFTELPEVIVESRQKKLLHILAYVREYSTLSTYSDTITLFREKMVDFMLPTEAKTRFKGWRNPRILNSKSYYRFTDGNGLDSVSDKCNHHFSWSDWVGILPPIGIPPHLARQESGTDTLSGKYSPTEIWIKNGDRVAVDVNVLADTTSRKWVPNLATFFKNDIDFEQFRLRLNYNDVVGDSLKPLDLTGYSFNIESRGRGRGMFRFNRYDEPFFVSTYTEVYILDKMYISVKEAKKWATQKFDDTNSIEILESPDAPDLQPATMALIGRVENLDTDQIRLSFVPDQRLGHIDPVRQKRNFSLGYRALSLLKILTGVTRHKMNSSHKRQWKKFRHEQLDRNRKRENRSQSQDEQDKQQ